MSASTKKRLVGRHQRQIEPVGEVDEGRLASRLFLQPMPRHLHVEPTGERLGQAPEAGLRRFGLPVRQMPPDRPRRPPGERDQPVATGPERVEGHLGLAGILGIHVRGAEQLQEIAIAGIVLCQQDQGISRRAGAVAQGSPRAPGFVAGDAELAADNGLDPGIGQQRREFQRPEQVVGIRHRYRRHAVPPAGRGKLGDANRPFQ